MCKAVDKLLAAQQRTGSILSVGLEPAPEYLPDAFPPNLEGFEEFLTLLIEATEGLACAYKANLAFFEAHGWEGMELLYTLREKVPADALFIADAKRSDIGSSAKHYAFGLFESLGADAATVNPLMGRDSVEPFLEYGDRLTFLLGLTSNPGADDFLVPNGLHLRIAAKAAEWNARGNAGLVVGATRPELVSEVRAAAPALPFLMPGLGAQGGDVAALKPARAGNAPVIVHATRAILPDRHANGELDEIIAEKAKAINRRCKG